MELRHRSSRPRRAARFLGLAGLSIVLVASGLAAPAPVPAHPEILAGFVAIDTTRNGAINAREWQAAGEALFQHTDRNRDGVVDRTEIGENKLMREAFPEADAKSDGRLNHGEFVRLRDIIFRAADIDRNDYITFVEYELLTLLRRTGWHDRNDDGRIEMSELRTVLTQSFPLLDRNHDGALTGDEAAFLAPEHREAMDPKQTGRITADQLINGYRFLLGADLRNHNL